MKHIRHIYRFYFHGKGINTCVEIKAETLKELYNKLSVMQPSLESLADRAWNCSYTVTHKRRLFPTWHCHNFFKSFMPSNLMSEREIKIAFRQFSYAAHAVHVLK